MGILVALTVTACEKSGGAIDRRSRIFEKQDLADEVRGKVARQLKKELDLRPAGTIGQMHYEIQILGLSFNYYHPVDIAEGRKLLVRAVEVMMQEVNTREKIRPYLIRYPFAPRNVEIHIILYNSDGRNVAPGSLWGMEASEGFLSYTIEHPETQRLITIYQETYEEALQRIADPTLPLVPFQPEDATLAPEELSKLRKSIRFVDNNGVIKHLGEDGRWIPAPRSP